VLCCVAALAAKPCWLLFIMFEDNTVAGFSVEARGASTRAPTGRE